MNFQFFQATTICILDPCPFKNKKPFNIDSKSNHLVLVLVLYITMDN